MCTVFVTLVQRFRVARAGNVPNLPVFILDKFNDWGGGEDVTYLSPFWEGTARKKTTGDIFDQPPGQMRRIWGKLADHVGDHVVSSSEGAVLVTSPGTKSSYPRLP